MKRTELLAGLSIRFSEKLCFYVSYYLQGNVPVKCILYVLHSLRLSYGIISTVGRFKKKSKTYPSTQIWLKEIKVTWFSYSPTHNFSWWLALCIKTNILGKYQNQYTTKCQAQLRETEIQKSVTKLFSYMLYHVRICICMYVCACIHTHTHTEWYKRLHTMGKWSLYLQNVLFMGTITLISHADESPLSRQTTPGVMHAYASLMRSFRWPVLCSFTWYSMTFKCTRK
jgi:hypothetical protein